MEGSFLRYGTRFKQGTSGEETCCACGVFSREAVEILQFVSFYSILALLAQC